MTEPWRCFVAAHVDDGLRGRLGGAVAAWRTEPRTDGLRWVGTEGLHLTLAFLGATDPDRIPEVERSLAGVTARHAPMTLRTGRLGAFHRPGSARVMWYAVADPDGRLAALAADVAEALDLAVDQPYRPHVTLARARRRAVDLRGWIEDASASAPEGMLTIREVHLMRSHLGREPARYETLASFTLGDDR
jgi:2'-5' RNA ligase